MKLFFQLLLLLGIIGGSPQALASAEELSSEVTSITAVDYQFTIQLALYDPSGELLHNDSVTTPMLVAALASLFCTRRFDVIVLSEEFANFCPESKDRRPFFENFVVRSLGRRGVTPVNNGTFTSVTWAIGFSILKIPDYAIANALSYAGTNETTAELIAAQAIRDELQDMVDYSCLDSSLDGLLHENAVERNYRMYCSPLDFPEQIMERWTQLDANSWAPPRLGETVLYSMLLTVVFLFYDGLSFVW